MSIYSWEIQRQLDDARVSYADRLASLLTDYDKRRSIQAHMIRDVAELTAGRVAEVEQFHEARHAAFAEAHAGEVARLTGQVKTYRESSETYRRMLDEKRTIREERQQKAGAEDCDVVISNGYHGWTVAGIEEIAYRLRCGGAVDDTPVDVDKNRATASVPAPNMVTLDASPKAIQPVQPVTPLSTQRGIFGFISTRWARVAALSALVTVLIGVVILR